MVVVVVLVYQDSSHQVTKPFGICNPAYMVPVPCHDKLARATSIKMVEMMEVRASIVRMGWCPSGLSVRMPVIFPWHHKTQKMAMYHPMGAHEWMFFLVLAHPGNLKGLLNSCVCVYQDSSLKHPGRAHHRTY